MDPSELTSSNAGQLSSALSQRLIISSFRRVLAEAGPRQAEVLRACAVPRWFDAEVLAVLRGREDGNQRVMELLRGYSFVRALDERRYTYQDDVRAALLAEWRADRPDEFRALNLRLADHFAARAAAAQPDQLRLRNLVLLVRPAGDWDLWEREALYHRLLADPPAGLQQLRAAFDQAEGDYRLADAEALLQVANDVSLDAAAGRWLRYMRARIARASLQLDTAIAQLEALLADPATEAQLAAEASQVLADALTETGQWARAIELYRASLGYFQQAGDQRRAAEVMLRLGEAYRGLGVNTGGWYVPAFPQRRRLRALGQAWYGLLGLPFVLVAAFLRRTPWALPLPRYAAPYQNWLLIRLYRTAQGWYERALAAFGELGDQAGTLRAKQQRAEILLLFGYADEALARLDELRARLGPQNTYRRLWLDCDRAAAQIACGDIAAAQALLAAVLAGFRAVGDARGEAAALALQGRAAEAAGNTAAALASYADSLVRFRMLRYAAAREQALYALRAWQRRAGPGPISQQINDLLDREPEKRYMARFPRSLLPLLQALVLCILPLALALTSLVTPTEVVQRVANSPLVQTQTAYNLWSGLIVLVILGLLALAIYTCVGLALIFFIPLDALEREQPDFLMTTPQGIARYDYRGALAQQLSWAEVRRWVRVDRRLWQRPMSLFSLTLLEAADGRDLRVDGIVGWYNGLQTDIERHLREVGNPARAEWRGVEFLRSGWGALLLFGVALLLLCISSENSWINTLVRLFGPVEYAAISLVAFSGILILIPLAYWLVAHPLALHRALSLPDRWPWIIGAVGLGAIGVGLFAGRLLPIDALKIGLLLWGVYTLADALCTIFLARDSQLHLAIIAGAVLVAGLFALAPLTGAYYDALRATYTRLADYASAAALPAEAGPDTQAATWEQAGNAFYLQGRYREALDAYTQALNLLGRDSSQPEARQQIAVIIYNRAATLQKLGRPEWRNELQSACALSQDVCANAGR